MKLKYEDDSWEVGDTAECVVSPVSGQAPDKPVVGEQYKVIGIRVTATSRKWLHLDGESIYRAQGWPSFLFLRITSPTHYGYNREGLRRIRVRGRVADHPLHD